MKIIKTPIKDLIVIEPIIHGDHRGFFLETYQKDRYQKVAEIKEDFIQDNHSRSSKGILRGLHYQKTKPQGKLVRVVQGEVFDVAVDLRVESETFGKWFGVTLSAETKNQFYVPPGFAHGFVVLSEFADFEYKCTDYYYPEDEETICWNDSSININWPIKNPILSKRDQNGKSFKELFS